jgi:hypothetical protein
MSEAQGFRVNGGTAKFPFAERGLGRASAGKSLKWYFLWMAPFCGTQKAPRTVNASADNRAPEGIPFVERKDYLTRFQK